MQFELDFGKHEIYNTVQSVKVSEKINYQVTYICAIKLLIAPFVFILIIMRKVLILPLNEVDHEKND